jgi:hypothetical protein
MTFGNDFQFIENNFENQYADNSIWMCLKYNTLSYYDISLLLDCCSFSLIPIRLLTIDSVDLNQLFFDYLTKYF